MTREKNIKGRKRHLMVDTFGFVLRVLVHAADISESEGGIWLLNEYADVLTSLEILRADQGYKQMFVEWVHQYLSCRVEIVTNHTDTDGAVVDAIVALGARGIVLAGTGGGTASEALEAALARAAASGVRVMRASRCAAGPVRPTPGRAYDAAGELTPAKARVAVQLALMRDNG